MPEVRFRKAKAPIQVPMGANLMQSLLAAGVPVASSCRGDGVCAKCRIEVTEGANNLSPRNPLEVSLADRHQIPHSERISCQTEILGDITVDTPYW
jgi:ferredoxin, 2Fe-2S